MAKTSASLDSIQIMKTCIKLVVVTPILLILSDSRILRNVVVQDPATSPWNLEFGARLFKTLIGKINARICSHQAESSGGPKGLMTFAPMDVMIQVGFLG